MNYQEEARISRRREARDDELLELVALEREQAVPLLDEDMRDAIDAAFDRALGEQRR